VLVDLLPGGFDVVVPNVAPEDQALLSSTAGGQESAGGRRTRTAKVMADVLACG